ncbi:MAG: hypothetical protein H7263_02305 [Candidatus Sericytochromatia bacterium]|nr:hypothetical protein [Candidatus Sericytochromatia bacterium]
MCGTELTNDNKTKEHIIPNFIGGKLKYSDLICRNCVQLFRDTPLINKSILVYIFVY